MHIAFALPSPAETGGGGGADYIDGLAGGLRGIGVRVETLVCDQPAFPTGSIPIVDGMLLPRMHQRLHELVQADAVALIHHIAASASRDPEAKARTTALEHTMLTRFRRVIATSTPVADRLKSEFGVNAHPILPGSRDAAPATPDPRAPVILSVGVLTRRKGHDRLIQAASRLLDLPWSLVIIGDAQREPAHEAELRSLGQQLGLTDRLSIIADPSPAELEREWRRATIFASATRWEGYPSALLEAMQRGIPTLTTTGANADALLPIDAGTICPIDDAATFGKCLRRLLFDTDLRTDMVKSARSAGERLPRWADRAREFLSVLEQNP